MSILISSLLFLFFFLFFFEDSLLHNTDNNKRVVQSWPFLIAESCLLAGLVQSAYHTRYRKVFFENPPDCETVRRGTFGAGAAFSLITCVLTGAYYFYFSKSRVSYARREATIGMSPYS